MAKTLATVNSSLIDKLDAELTALANDQFNTPEFRLLFDLPLTLKRAQFLAVQMVFYNLNRRECWALVQAHGPWEIKQLVWEHEKDELHYDPRGGSDHRVMMAKEALVLGVTEKELEKAEPTPLLSSTLRAFAHINESLPWLGAMTASHFLERRNNGKIVKGGGLSARWRDKMVRELRIDPSLLISSNVHVEADMDHSDSIWDAICHYVVDDYSYRVAREGAQACVIADRAYRAALAHEMNLLEPV